jgi:diguanylate cyclase (GGDEF)-like protein/PAS domain S-box-containing protein
MPRLAGHEPPPPTLERPPMPSQPDDIDGLLPVDDRPGGILLVDDLPQNRLVLGRRLSALGYAVAEAEDGEAALARVAEGGIELVLLDVNMPRMGGLEALAELRKTHGPAELPVIMLTASEQSGIVLRAIQAGANDYVVQPVQFDDLLRRVVTQLGRRRAEAALRISEERFKLALRASNQGIWDWNRETGAIYFSPNWKALIGCGEADGPASFEDWLALAHPEDRPLLAAAIEAYARGAAPQLDVEYRIRHRAGGYRWVRTRGAAYASSRQTASRIVGSQSDITDRKLVDAVTGLPNRIQFQEALEHALGDESRRPFAVALINIDRFRLTNEALGSDSGDLLLKAFADRFRAGLAPHHMLARLGGDHFALLAHETAGQTAMSALISTCRRQFETPIPVGEHALHVSFRVGAVIADDEHRVPGDLLYHADIALRSAKLQPEGRVAFAQRPARGVALARLQLENDLHRALAGDEFIAVFQPIVTLETGRTVGFEALARWRHPERGMVPPGSFIGVAEETGLIGGIDDKVLALACREAMQWPGRPFVAVNISGYRFGDPELVAGIDATVSASALDPRRLKLEITESTIMTDASATARTVKAIAARGIGVSIDDFGTGYSSLAYLHRFDATTLKIDRSFVNAMETDQGLEIVRTIIMLARTLEMSVVAEGIETLAQYDALRALGCEYGQGYYFAKPLSAADARRRLVVEAGSLQATVPS